MMKLVDRFLPKRIGSQIVMLVLLTVIVSAAITAANNAIARQNFENAKSQYFNTFLIASAAKLIGDTNDVASRRTILDAVNKARPSVELALMSEPIPDGLVVANMRPFSSFTQDLGAGFRIFVPAETPLEDIRQICIELPDGTRLDATIHLVGPPPPPIINFPAIMLFLAISLPSIVFWAVFGLSRRLRTFSRAAAEFSIHDVQQPLNEDGPEELRIAARAINRMRERIAEFVDDRTRMLSSVGHDLRTPITRLRLRAEFIEDKDIREGFMRDLDRMHTMVESALTFLRDGYTHGQRNRIDLSAFLQTICDEYADMGNNVDYDGPDQISAEVYVDDLERAISNLVENSLKFGTRARIRLKLTGDDKAIIAVDDDGPGIPAEVRDNMMKPFVRGDDTRHESTGGFGLGLAIVAAISRQHLGELSLTRSDLGGLSAQIMLPLSPDRGTATRRLC